ncbi:Zwei Ig domain protein zig-8 [Nymphon striatum]|nr:Zwei Ig domain protein zig-8 [Nymphon striatum]
MPNRPGPPRSPPQILMKTGLNEPYYGISWIRQKDYQILTVGTLRYTGEERFNALPRRETGDWVLQINFVHPNDSGIYECQIGTDPKISLEVYLKVEEATAMIRGGSSLHVHVGSDVTITCEVSSHSIFVLWYHNGTQITEESNERYEISKINGSPTISTLTFKNAKLSDAGHYSCDPSNAKPQNMTLHLVEGEKASPMLHDRSFGNSIHFRMNFATFFTCLLLHKLLLLSIR